MNSLDTVSIILCLIFLGLGFYNGLIKSVSSLIALVVSLYCAKKLEPFISKLLTIVHIKNPEGVIGYLFVFFCIFISVKLLLLILRKVTRASGLSPIDRIFGGILGLTKGIIIVMIACTILQLALPRDAAILRDSKLLPHFNKIVRTARGLIPNDMYRHISRGGKTSFNFNYSVSSG